MRTDVKVGLICVFALVLAVVAYFAFQSNPDKQKAQESSVVATGSTPSEGASGSGALAVAPVEAATTSAPSMTAPETPIAGGGSLLGPRTALAQVAPADNTFTGPIIQPPGSVSTAPAPSPYPSSSLVTSPSIPSTGPALSGPPSLLPPVTPAPTYTPSPTSSYIPTPTPTPHPTIDVPPHRPSAFDTPLPGPTETFSPGPTLAGGASTYLIQKGDMLGAIAKKNSVTLKALQAANPGLNPNKMKIGTKINIPAPAPAAPAMPAPATTRPSTSHRTTTRPATTRPAVKVTIKPGTNYTIKKGDTLLKIAKAAYGDSNGWRRIFRANRGDMSDANDLTIGQVIKIPK